MAWVLSAAWVSWAAWVGRSVGCVGWVIRELLGVCDPGGSQDLAELALHDLVNSAEHVDIHATDNQIHHSEKEGIGEREAKAGAHVRPIAEMGDDLLRKTDRMLQVPAVDPQVAAEVHAKSEEQEHHAHRNPGFFSGDRAKGVTEHDERGHDVNDKHVHDGIHDARHGQRDDQNDVVPERHRVGFGTVREVEFGNQVARVREQEQPDNQHRPPDPRSRNGVELRDDGPGEKAQQQENQRQHGEKHVPEHGPVERHAKHEGAGKDQADGIDVEPEHSKNEEHVSKPTWRAATVAGVVASACAVASVRAVASA